uniref:Uncharacterized protein n=1 Tax=Syphacia muris TaxID=451379 RepID=A0A0N5ABU4_9BILA
MTKVERILKKVKQPPSEKQTSLGSEPQVVQSQVSHSSYPQVEIKGYEGNIADWPAFWSRFNCAVYSTSTQTIDKFLRLQSLLKGPAWDLVKGFLTTPENYPIVTDLLRDKFRSDEKIQTTLRKQLWLLPAVREGNPTKLLFDMETILQKYETTKSFINVHHLEDMIMHRR